MCACTRGLYASVSGSVRWCLCVSVCVLALVVPVRHDRRRELKPIGAKRLSHIPMRCVCVCVSVESDLLSRLVSQTAGFGTGPLAL